MSDEEKPLSVLERLIRWGIERESATMIDLNEQGGFTHSIAYYRGRISSFKTVLDLIEWYDLDLQSSEFKENDPLGESANNE